MALLLCAGVRGIDCDQHARGVPAIIIKRFDGGPIRKILFIFIALVLGLTSAQAQNASEVLVKMASVYATCRTYSDEAVTKSTVLGAGEKHSAFRTNFVRPNNFRFEVWLNSDKPGKGHSAGVWRNGDVVQMPGVSSFGGALNLPFDSALARMAALSAGGSLTIPQLLLPREFRTMGWLNLIVNPNISGEEKIDGKPAFRIDGTLLGQPLTLWIDKNRYLILKNARRVLVGDRIEDSTTQYKPKLNEEIAPEILALPSSSNQIIIAQSTSISAAPTSTGPPVLTPKLKKFGSSLGSLGSEANGLAGAGSADDEDVVRVVTDLVVCPVLVLDPQGKIVNGLTREDFLVKEDDRAQEVASVSLGDNKDLPRSIVLIIDYSGSQLPYIKTSIESARMLVDKLNPKDRMAIVTDDVKLLVDFTSDKQLLKTRLEGLKTGALSGALGASEQYDALLATLNELFNSEDTRPIIIFQTDGDQLEALKDGQTPSPYTTPRKYSLADILTATERTRAAVYSVISGIKFIGVPEAEVPRQARVDWENRQAATRDLMRAKNLSLPKATSLAPGPADEFFVTHGKRWLQRQTALAEVAQHTGTLPEFLEDPSQADEIYTRILNDIDRRYVIGYYPTNRAHDGKRRRVSIEVRGHPDYTVWGQKAYYAREEK